MLSADPHLLHGAAGVMTTPVKAVSAVGDNGAMTTNHTELFVTPSGRRTGKVTPPSGAGSGAGVAGLARSRKLASAKSARSVIYNPFDVGLVDRLHRPVFSPSVFAKNSCPGSEEKTPTHFRWTIDQLAIMKPADIDETAMPPVNIIFDHQEEARAQQAIDRYFAMQPVLPSPWTDSAHRKPFRLPMTPGVESAGCSPAMAAPASDDTTREVSCQTSLSLPNDFNLLNVLAIYHSGGGGGEGEEGAPTTLDDLSSSSLRRKLFFQGDEGTPLSPVSSRVSFAVTPPHGATGATALPSGGIAQCQFSSSPIHRMSTSDARTGSTRGRCGRSSQLHRCSTVPDVMASPELSPVAGRRQRDLRRRSSADGSCSSPLTQGAPTAGSRPRPDLPAPDVSPIAFGEPIPLFDPDDDDRSTEDAAVVWTSPGGWLAAGRPQLMDVDASSSSGLLPPDGASSHDTGYSTASIALGGDATPNQIVDEPTNEIADDDDVAMTAPSDLTRPFSRLPVGGPDGSRTAAPAGMTDWTTAGCHGDGDSNAPLRARQYVERLLHSAAADVDAYCGGSTVRAGAQCERTAYPATMEPSHQVAPGML